MRTRILIIFALSGAAGLIDEIVWSRQLVLVFGNTTQAVSAILTGFFGGMAIGAPIGGRIADRVRSPLRLYGYLEIALVVVVIATPLTFRLINEVYRGIYPSLEGSPQALALVRMGLAVLALAPATILMGATLPSLTRYLTQDGHLSKAFGRLYAANIVGAIVGTLAAGFVLIELLGLTGALAVGAACSAIAGVAAILLDRRHPAALHGESAAPVEPVTTVAEASPPPVEAAGAPRASRVGLALTIAFVSGLTSLGYQVLWTRLLASGTGNTTYVFTVILALFLTGLAIGALIFNLVRPRITDPVAPVGGGPGPDRCARPVRAHRRHRESHRHQPGRSQRRPLLAVRFGDPRRADDDDRPRPDLPGRVRDAVGRPDDGGPQHRDLPRGQHAWLDQRQLPRAVPADPVARVAACHRRSWPS